jgi:hypothetical protein
MDLIPSMRMLYSVAKGGSMLADLARVANSLREDTLGATLVRLRDEIARGLKETGAYKVREGGREFTISIERGKEGGSAAGPAKVPR